MKVFVINKANNPLMPTTPKKARLLLKEKKAVVVKKTPFTIKLLVDCTCYKQPVTLGIDSGSKTAGFCLSTPKESYLELEVELRNDVVDLIATKKMLRRSRRDRKTRYREDRYSNRVSTKKKGWVAPSVRQKIDTHLNVIDMLTKICPVNEIIIETASFDIQKIKNPDIKGVEYQQGEQKDFWNVREYVLSRDSHTCQCCKGKSKDKILNVHHIESRKTGGNAPNNLITLCETCHTGYHKGVVKLPSKIKRGMKFNDAAFMSIMRWAFFDKVKEKYSAIPVHMTYGYITKNTRIENKLPKEHRVDALCISKNPKAKRDNVYYYMIKKRCHNRQIHKMKIIKGGKRKNNQAPFEVFGFRLWDKVLYDKQICFISSRRVSGYFKICTLDGTVINNAISYKKLKLIEHRKNYVIERRTQSIA